MSFLKSLIRRIFRGLGREMENEAREEVESQANEFADEAVKRATQSAAQNGQSSEQEDEATEQKSSPAEHQVQADQFKNAASMPEDVIKQWVEKIPQYPLWCLGGSEFEIEEMDGAFYFTACFESHDDAQQAINLYRRILMQDGFRPSGGNPNSGNFFKALGGKRYQADTEHCFDSDDKALTIGFAVV